MLKLLQVKNPDEAERVIAFLCSKEAFDLEMNEFRKETRRDAVYGSLIKDSHRYWYVEETGKVIAALGVAENERENGGYHLDYFAVHKNFRQKGLGFSLLKKAEDFVKSRAGRYILIDTGDTKTFTPARKFYEKNGYEAVGHIPDYYEKGDGRIDYYKKFN